MAWVPLMYIFNIMLSEKYEKWLFGGVTYAKQR